MKSVIILALIFASAVTVNIIAVQPSKNQDNKDPLQTQFHMLNNLQIANYTGSGITPDMVSTFIKVINEAYTYYPLYLQANAYYIQNKLEGTYTGDFQVLIFPENSTASLRIYARSSGTAFVAWSKVNAAQPTWTYIISIISADTLQNSYVDGYIQKGPGVSSTLQKEIQSIIDKYETGQQCLCLAGKVGIDLEALDGQKWNVVCGAPKAFQGGFSGYIYQKDGIYLHTELLPDGITGLCRYLAWVI